MWQGLTFGWWFALEGSDVMCLDYTGVQQYGNKLVLGLRRIPVDPYIIYSKSYCTVMSFPNPPSLSR
jgi:hypothetical protein